MKKKIYNDEVDLFDLIVDLLNQKSKIFIITSVLMILGSVYHFLSNKYFIAETNIKSISTFENQKYDAYNRLAAGGLFNITSENLLNLFVSKIRTTEIIEEGIRKFDIVDKENFKSEKKLNEEIRKVAILIIENVSPPINDEKNKSENSPYWKIKYKIDDKNKWINFLEFLEKRANEEIRKSLLNRFDIEINILRLSSKFNLEDIELSISNALDDYKIQTSNKLAFLYEQAEIARTLNIAKNTLEAENFQSENTVVTNIKSESSYYLKGYEMIEKEISLINSRENKKAFIANLLELENKKRSILQDKKVERLELLFYGSPMVDKNDFKSAKINYISTSFKPQQSLFKILSISVVIGLLISFLIIIITNAKNNRK